MLNESPWTVHGLAVVEHRGKSTAWGWSNDILAPVLKINLFSLLCPQMGRGVGADFRGKHMSQPVRRFTTVHEHVALPFAACAEKHDLPLLSTVLQNFSFQSARHSHLLHRAGSATNDHSYDVAGTLSAGNDQNVYNCSTHCCVADNSYLSFIGCDSTVNAEGVATPGLEVRSCANALLLLSLLLCRYCAI
jgi:hypothetical protein